MGGSNWDGKKLHDEEHHNLCPLRYINTLVIRSKKVRGMAHVVCRGEMGNSYGISVWEPEEKVQLRRKI